MKRILVPTDFSDPSLPSFKFAVDLASAVNGEVFVIHMINLPLLQETTFGIQPAPSDPDLLAKMEEAAMTGFERFKQQYPTKIQLTFSPLEGDVVPGTVSFIKENNIDLVVLSTHGASAYDDFFSGSTTGQIARSAPVPVFTIPRDTTLTSIKHIVHPNSLEPGQDELMTYVKELQTLFGARLHILFINTRQHFHSDEESKDLLEQFAAHHALANYTLNCRSDEHETTGIMAFMDEIKADMLAMSTHGRTGLAHLLRGSIAESILYGSDHPVWTWKRKGWKYGRT